MEAIRISCAGYPTRRTFSTFVDRFGILAPEVLDGRYGVFELNVIWIYQMFDVCLISCIYLFFLEVMMISLRQRDC